MTTYRDDLEAALHRNAALQRRLDEIEGAHAAPEPVRTATAASPPPSPTSPATTNAPTAPRSRIVYARPLTYFPLLPFARRSLALARRDFARRVWLGWLPRRPRTSYPIADLVLAPLWFVFMGLVAVAHLVWPVLWTTWFATTVVGWAIGTPIASALVVPVISALSLRRQVGSSRPSGLRWGEKVDDTTARLFGPFLALTTAYLAGLACIVVLA